MCLVEQELSELRRSQGTNQRHLQAFFDGQVKRDEYVDKEIDNVHNRLDRHRSAQDISLKKSRDFRERM